MKLHATDPDIQTIVARIENGDLDLQPDFQRGEVWPNQKKRRLIDSILRDWHVPPIHVVVEKGGRQVVLDGQQRLAAIRDFVNDDLTVDGNAEPHDPGIVPLDGLRYSQLPVDIRRAFEQFTIRVLPEADAPDVEIEDFDGAENLMIEAAIVASGGTIVRRAVPRGQEMRDLAGFEACLMQVVKALKR